MLPQENWRMLESGLSLTDPIAQTSNRKSKAERLTWSGRVSLQIPSLGSKESVQLHGCRHGLVKGTGAATSLCTLRDSPGSVFGKGRWD